MAESFNQATSQNSSHIPLEQFVPAVRQQNGLFTQLPVVVNNNLLVASVASLTLASAQTVNFNAAAITACGASTASFKANLVGGTGAPTNPNQYGWTQVQVGGTTAWIPIWH